MKMLLNCFLFVNETIFLEKLSLFLKLFMAKALEQAGVARATGLRSFATKEAADRKGTAKTPTF